MENKKVSFDPSVYPRVYKAARKLYIMVFMMLLCMIFLQSFFLLYIFYKHGNGNVFVIPCTEVFLSIFLIRDIFAKITLYSDRIVYESRFSKREMLRKDVAKLGFVPSKLMHIPVLRNKDETKKPFRIFDPSVKDDAWKAWMSFH
jgi:hypothetical protein